MTPTEFTTFVVFAIMGALAIAFTLGWFLGQDAADAAASRTDWEKHREADPYPDLPPDKFDQWIESIGADGAERLAEPETVRLYGNPELRAEMTTTGELRALAYAGNTDELAADTAAYLAHRAELHSAQLAELRAEGDK